MDQPKLVKILFYENSIKDSHELTTAFKDWQETSATHSEGMHRLPDQIWNMLRLPKKNHTIRWTLLHKWQTINGSGASYGRALFVPIWVLQDSTIKIRMDLRAMMLVFAQHNYSDDELVGLNHTFLENIQAKSARSSMPALEHSRSTALAAPRQNMRRVLEHILNQEDAVTKHLYHCLLQRFDAVPDEMLTHSLSGMKIAPSPSPPLLQIQTPIYTPMASSWMNCQSNIEPFAREFVATQCRSADASVLLRHSTLCDAFMDWAMRVKATNLRIFSGHVLLDGALTAAIERTYHISALTADSYPGVALGDTMAALAVAAEATNKKHVGDCGKKIRIKMERPPGVKKRKATASSSSSSSDHVAELVRRQEEEEISRMF